MLKYFLASKMRDKKWDFALFSPHFVQFFLQINIHIHKFIYEFICKFILKIDKYTK